MGFANLTDPNYKLQTNSDGAVVAIVSPGGDSTPVGSLTQTEHAAD